MENKVVTIQLVVPAHVPIHVLDPVDQVSIMHGEVWKVEGAVTEVMTLRGYLCKDSK